MKQTKTYCDTCEGEIKKGYGVDQGNLKLTGRKKKNETRMARIVWDDLCHECSAELFDILTEFKKRKLCEVKK